MSGPTTWIVLFRGVGGAMQLPVKPLREALTAAGFERVATYINSGNAIVRSPLSRGDIISIIADLCRREFGFDKAVHVLSRDEWDDLVAANPFPEALSEPKFLHAAVLAGLPADGAVEALQAVAVDGEGIAVVGHVAYLHTPNGFGRSKLAEKFDRGIGAPNTARNWNTVLKLQALAAEADVD